MFQWRFCLCYLAGGLSIVAFKNYFKLQNTEIQYTVTFVFHRPIVVHYETMWLLFLQLKPSQ